MQHSWVHIFYFTFSSFFVDVLINDTLRFYYDGKVRKEKTEEKKVAKGPAGFEPMMSWPQGERVQAKWIEIQEGRQIKKVPFGGFK